MPDVSGAGPSAPSEPATIALAADCTARNAPELMQRLRAALDEPLPVAVDVAAVERIDTVGLQLVTAFVRDRAQAGQRVEWRGRSSAFVEAATLLGLVTLLGLSPER